MAYINALDIGKQFGDFVLFSDFRFDVEPHHKIGLIGPNGCGKTTLFRMLMNPRYGESPSELGALRRSRELRVGYMEQHTCTRPERTLYEEVVSVFEPVMAVETEMEAVAETLRTCHEDALIERQHRLHEQFAAMGGLIYRSRTGAALAGLGFAPETFSQPVSTLSGGQRSKAAMCRLLLSDANLLLLDEPTNHLDIASVEWLEEFLRSYSGAYIVISHDRFFLDRVTSRTFEIAHHKLIVTEGSYSVHAALREKNREVREKHYKMAQREIRRQEESIATLRSFNREKSVRRAESKQKALDRFIETVDAPEAETAAVRFRFNVRSGTGNEVIVADGLAAGYGSRRLFENYTFTVFRRERVFLLGPNGCGKTTLLRTLIGQLAPRQGYTKFGARVDPGYYDQTQSELPPRQTVLDAVWSAYPSLSQTAVRSALASFLFRGDDIHKLISELSGGERARVLLLRLMLAGQNLLLLDEPTNHLDIAAREALEEALEAYDGTLFIVSHDRYFINRLATRTLRMTPDGCISTPGNYDAFLEATQKPPPAPAEPDARPAANDYKLRKEQESMRRRVAGRVARAEDAVAAAEERVAALHRDMERCAGDYEQILRCTNALAEAQRQLDGTIAVWETAVREQDAINK